MRLLPTIGKIVASVAGLAIIGVMIVSITSVIAESNPDESRPQPPASDNPGGATAICRDGMYSFSPVREGTCSGHGGVAEWL